MTGKYCPQCGTKDCQVHKINGNGIRQEIQHQDEKGRMAHKQIESEISRLERESRYRYEKNEQAIKELYKHLDSKFKFILTLVIAILGTLGSVVFAGDITINDDIQKNEALVSEAIRQTERTAALQEAILAGNVRIAAEVAAEERMRANVDPPP